MDFTGFFSPGPKNGVARTSLVELTVTPLGKNAYRFTSDEVEIASITNLDIDGRQIARGKSDMIWTAPPSQAYLIVVQAKKNGRFLRRFEKLPVQQLLLTSIGQSFRPIPWSDLHGKPSCFHSWVFGA